MKFSLNAQMTKMTEFQKIYIQSLIDYKVTERKYDRYIVLCKTYCNKILWNLKSIDDDYLRENKLKFLFSLENKPITAEMLFNELKSDLRGSDAKVVVRTGLIINDIIISWRE